MNEVLVNKAQSIERCIQRIKSEYIDFEDEIATNFTKQDAIVLNLQRACQSAIDMATHYIKIKGLQVPQTSRESFSLLEENELIPPFISNSMQNMVGFRNIAVHDYAKLNIDILKAILDQHLTDFSEFSKILLQDSNE